MVSPSLHHKFSFLSALLLVSLIVPGSLASDTIVTHDQPYTLFQVFGITFGMGLLFLVVSFIVSKEQNADIFAAMAIVPLLVSAWMANQLDFPTKYLLPDSTDLITQHNIYSSWPLIIFCAALGIIAAAQLYRLLTTPDKSTSDPNSGNAGRDEEESDDDQDSY